MNHDLQIIEDLKLSKKFQEGYNIADGGCRCEKCRISRYRHTHEPELADPAHSYWEYLSFCINNVTVDGLWLEFGVGSGKSLSFIAEHKPANIIYGFDSFHGLPDDWALSEQRIYKKSTYSRNGVAPVLAVKNAEIITGLFTETLDSFCRLYSAKCAFIHIDCDLYSSTIEVLNTLHKHAKLIAGTVILFDELYNYPFFREYEYKAFEEFFGLSGLNYQWIAHTESAVEWNGNQAALMLI
ncbi:MAG: hypothetical protein JWR38_5161 [Mucilaginibacter sp.]|nr:hypothetical protein [Mucilaginibacter sp.]